jgi:hypothetical protein
MKYLMMHCGGFEVLSHKRSQSGGVGLKTRERLREHVEREGQRRK